ncbi:hypothetical protein [Actinospica robiniae]|uniref:hypothetical protein n=1 Tax=Actinospica robiniae TaxID=304901 RepID=UPI00041FAA6C|nr:hypothetical protein [Actinospica robiniae]
MGYDLHITRADFCYDSAVFPISRAEWTEFAESEPQVVRHTGEDGGECWEFLAADGNSWLMNWFQGAITIWKGHGAGAEIARVAARLGARVIGDDAAEYHPDGSVVPWTGPRPALLPRPWNVEEAADAWDWVFRQREDLGCPWQPAPGYARHALAAFRTFAGHAVSTADAPEPERLSYSYSQGEHDGAPTVALRLTRLLATDPDGGYARVTCHLYFPASEDLAGLGAFQSTWSVRTGGTRDEWFEALAARPEWDLFDLATPCAFGFETSTA